MFLTALLGRIPWNLYLLGGSIWVRIKCCCLEESLTALLARCCWFPSADRSSSFNLKILNIFLGKNKEGALSERKYGHKGWCGQFQRRPLSRQKKALCIQLCCMVIYLEVLFVLQVNYFGHHLCLCCLLVGGGWMGKFLVVWILFVRFNPFCGLCKLRNADILQCRYGHFRE